MKKLVKPYIVFALIIAYIWVKAYYFRVKEHSIVSNQIFVAVTSYLVAFLLLYGIINVFFYVKKISKCSTNNVDGVLAAWISNHRFVLVFVTMLLFWAYPVVISYPANMNWDAWYQLQQFWRFSPFDTHQPIVHTIVMGVFTYVGKVLGSGSVGLFLFIVFQTIIYALIVSYAFVLLDRLYAPLWLRLIYLITCIFSPYYVNSVGSVIKDSLYSIFFLLMIIELIYAMIDLDTFLDTKYHWFLSMISLLAVLTLRSNGKHILYPLYLLLSIVLIKRYWGNNKDKVIKPLIIMVVPVVIMLSFNVAFKASVSEVKDVSIVESLSLPFQQTARTIVEHSEQISASEKRAIDAVLYYDQMAEKYDSRISDPIKALYKDGCSKEDLRIYLQTWIKMFFKYPRSYVDAVVEQNYGLVYPFYINDTVFMDYLADGELAGKFAQKINLKEYKGFEHQKDQLYNWYMLMYHIPIWGLLSNPAFYVFILLLLFIDSVIEKKLEQIILMLPLILCVVCIILGPVLHGHPRYAFPIIYSIPLVYAFVLRKKENND